MDKVSPESMPLDYMVNTPIDFKLENVNIYTIKLLLNAKDYNLILENPFTTDQKLSFITPKVVSVEFEEEISNELINRIRSFGKNIQILSPESLKVKFAIESLESYLNYLTLEEI